MEQSPILQFSDPAPYPPVQVWGPDARYAKAMLSNIGSCNSEMSAVSLYFYNSIITRKTFKEAADCFQKIGMVEMYHLDLFGQLAWLLGADPRLWSYGRKTMSYWSPGCNKYPGQIVRLLDNAIRGENEAIEKYRQQAAWIKDPNIVDILNRVILDEECHIRIFHQLYQDLSE
ncbi:ferritin-like domain-containing protein [Bacilliculturomica massiliensis]|uniref:ferritin-like domain-containing protein n=1 Tax=Bacilliculturomica massiliensis TaxID=1917867 RepID=UPI0010316456|nr:manganese catalase family protein [Bacilliculturomica massiliensis]